MTNRILLPVLGFAAIAGALFLLVAAMTARAAEPRDPSLPIVQGNNSYEQGDYQRALELYDLGLKLGAKNGHLYYNLANAEYRLGQIGKAIAYYRLAQEDMPSDPDVRVNLALARKQVKEKVTSGAEESLISADRFFPLNHEFNREQLKAVFLTLYLVFWVNVVLLVFFRRPAFQTSLIIFGLLTAYSALTVFGTKIGPDGSVQLALTPSAWSTVPGVITASEVKVYSGNSETFQVVFVLHDGVELEVGERRGDWVQVLLSGGRKGWVKDSEIQVL